MGSHGGQLPGCIAIRKFARAVILNDAGVGLDKAGISSLELCEKIKMAAATVSSMSCRIGNGYDMVERGIISYVNLSGAKLGVHEGMLCKIAIAKFVQANVAIQREVSNFREVKKKISIPGYKKKVILVDSASMLDSNDKNQVVVTGSHGGLIGENSKFAIKVPVHAAFFNDAGGGIENCGVSRLPVLDELGIAGIALDCMSCHIGSAVSAFETGKISVVNQKAANFGVKPGMLTKEAVQYLLA